MDKFALYTASKNNRENEKDPEKNRESFYQYVSTSKPFVDIFNAEENDRE